MPDISYSRLREGDTLIEGLVRVAVERSKAKLLIKFQEAQSIPIIVKVQKFITLPDGTRQEIQEEVKKDSPWKGKRVKFAPIVTIRRIQRADGMEEVICNLQYDIEEIV